MNEASHTIRYNEGKDRIPSVQATINPTEKGKRVGGKTNLPFSFIASFLIQMKYNMPITISH